MTKKVLAVTKDGRVTYCICPPEQRGIGRCNHIEHQRDGETEEEFINRSNDICADYSSKAPSGDIALSLYRMTDEEKSELVEIKGRKQLADPKIDKGGYISLPTPLWNDADKKAFAELSGVSLSNINSILYQKLYIVQEETEDGAWKKGSFIRKKQLNSILDKYPDIKVETGVRALNKYAKEKCDFEATTDVFVLPYYMRQDPPEGEGKHPLNSLYNYLIIRRKDPNNQQLAYERLLDNKNSVNPMKSRMGYAIQSLSDEFNGKRGVMRAHMSGRRIAYSGRAVITPDIHMEYGEAAIPASMAARIFKPTIEDRLKQEGFTDKEIELWFKKFDKPTPNIDKKDMQELSLIVRESGVKVILNRQPSLHRSSLLAFKPRISKDATIKVNPMNCPGYNADFDGDEMSCYAINDLRIVAKTSNIDASSEAGTRLSRHKDTNIIMPTKESLFGLLNILSNRSE